MEDESHFLISFPHLLYLFILGFVYNILLLFNQRYTN
jgi:hypothetical protein